ncbi:MAG: Dyp-type peroxidase [Nitrospira sp.]|nr:Dyp-type peroxidase [Nitrospira sp.]MDH4328621.1 Dyp-type peroxidase [Nitrospira sp.]MDH5252133.1 Dyp-type peroxidase [Nitrospira sp.]
MKPSLSQPGILAAPLPVGRSLTFRMVPGADVSVAVKRFGKGFSTSWGVMGVGEPLVCVLGRKIPGLRAFPELAAPASAHVKRSAQESFDLPAFMVRRSMPWATAQEQGLEFIAYVESLDRFERVLRRMAGLDDGIVDGLFTFSRPLTGGYYWCPPVTRGRLNLSYLGL